METSVLAKKFNLSRFDQRCVQNSEAARTAQRIEFKGDGRVGYWWKSHGRSQIPWQRSECHAFWVNQEEN